MRSWIALVLLLSGCTSQLQQPTASTVVNRPIANPKSLQMVRDLARPWGLKWIEVEGVSLVVGLAETGSDPPPSAERNMLQNEMQVRKVNNSDAVLSSSSTALAMVRALLPPGAQEGDRVDIEVRIPARSETTSLLGGWLMLARLREFALLNNRLSEGHLMAMCQGEILVDAVVEGSDDPVLLTRGRILGGGVVSQSRELGLRVRDEHLSVKTSARIGDSINRRFSFYSNGDKKGVATPKKDSFIQLAVHPRYRENIVRYVRVIEHIPVRETQTELSSRLKALQPRLMDPDLASETAVQLEAIGTDAIPLLLEGLQASNPEVRFYSAEALGYVDQPEAARVLAEAIRNEPAFRWRGFRALEAMDDMAAQEELAMLLHEDSAETRYGAFRALLRLSPDDPLVRGTVLGGQFQFHTVDSAAEPLLHIAKSERPEIVIFGSKIHLQHPVMLFAGKQIAIRSTDDGRIRVRRLSANEDDQQRIVSDELSDVIRAIVELGGKYTDTVEAISAAKRHNNLPCRLEFSALPTTGRTLRREDTELAAAPPNATKLLPSQDEFAVATEPAASQAPPAADRLGAVDRDLPRPASPAVPGEVKFVDEDDLSGLILFDDEDLSGAGLAPVIQQIDP